MLKDGAGVHQWDLRLKDLISLLYVHPPLLFRGQYADLISKHLYICAIMYCITVFTIKLSILLQYLRIFAPMKTKDMIYWGIHTVIWLNLAYYLAGVFVEAFLCNPREKYWNVLLDTGHCYNRDAINIVSGIINTVSDFAILLLPQKVIWKLQIPLKRKLAVSAIFLIGLWLVPEMFHFALQNLTILS